jgi:tetratricopeptide (TPR) repeat protein
MKAVQSKPWLLAAAIIFLTLLAYQPVWHAGFIWDDEAHVTGNTTLRTFDGLRQIWFEPRANQQYYPLQLTSFWLEYHLWKLQPLGYHLVNVLLHAFNAVLLWRVLRRLAVPGAWLAAAVFALHPAMVESVAWITERKNVLSCLFYLLAALAFLRFRPLTEGKADRAGDWRFYALLLVAFLCALFSKTVTCTLPAALLLVVWWKTGRIERRDVLAMMPLFVLGAALGRVTLQMEKHAGASGSEWTLSFVQRCLLAGRALWFYAGKLFCPLDLTFIYPHWQIDAGAAWQYAFPLAALALVVALWLLRSWIGRGPLAAVLFFAGTLVPALGFFDVYPFRYSHVADHFQYLACIGLIALTVNASAMMFRRIGGHTRGIAVAASVALLMALESATWQQAHVYRDLETLWRDTLAKNPTAWMAHNNLSAILTSQGKIEEAIWHATQALRLNPNHWSAHNNLGNAFSNIGRVREAIGEYEQALRLMPGSPEAHYNLGIVLERAGRLEDAIAHYEQAVQLKPDYVEAHGNLGNALAQAGQVKDAIEQLQIVLRLTPDSLLVHYNLGNAFLQAGQTREAIAQYEQALQLKPDYAEAHNNLGDAFLQAGQVKDAIEHFEQAARLKPDSPLVHKNLGSALEQSGKAREAIVQYEEVRRIEPDDPAIQNNLAWLLATLAPADGGDPVRAVTLAEQACQLTNNQMPPYLDTLAAAYASAGRFDDAVATAQKAIELARAANQTQAVKEIAGRLELYRSRHAYRKSVSEP